ncbi:MAG TPA: hypothetical protein PK747_01425 [Acidobacteriota bacterium]|nr:hypothetical protein [Acidobacteriota bacterium]HNT17114.1 hypothetical protein [Acidobacteriota bacterium]HPA26126.1 hypothetical protein [Acidobacteriota bacterium]HQO19241.1 hypothetical protein [Acidobacteriota bacterium]HQQ46053.1 hypothetical protein [Acidobacteriota bacterium]
MKNILEYLPPAVPSASFLLEDGILSGVRTEKKKASFRFVSKISETAFEVSSEEWPQREEMAPAVERALLSLGNPDRAAFLLPDVVFRMQVLELENFPKSEEEKEKILLWQARRNLGHPVQDLRIRQHLLEKDGDFTRLWAAAAPRELLAGIEKLFSDRGCHLGFISSPVMVLHPLLEKKGIMKSDGLELLLNMTSKSITFLFTRDGLPVFFRTKELRSGDETADRFAQEIRLTLAFQREKLGNEGLKRVCHRVAGDDMFFPAEDFDEGTEVVSLNDISPDTETDGIRGYSLLPLLASLEEE